MTHTDNQDLQTESKLGLQQQHSTSSYNPKVNLPSSSKVLTFAHFPSKGLQPVGGITTECCRHVSRLTYNFCRDHGDEMCAQSVSSVSSK